MEAILQLARAMPRQVPDTDTSLPPPASSTVVLLQQALLAQQAANLAGLATFGQEEFKLRLQLLIGQFLTASAVEAEVKRLRASSLPQAESSDASAKVHPIKNSLVDGMKATDNLSADSKLQLLSALATSRLGHSLPAQTPDILAITSQTSQVTQAPIKQEPTRDDSDSSNVSSQETTMTEKPRDVVKSHKNASIASGFKRKTKREQFPEKLYRILEELEHEGQDDIVSFVNQGSAFEIHQPEAFEEQVLPRYFRQGGIASFKKQLHLYNFRRIKTDSRGFAASLIFHHPNFQRGKPELCLLMDRVNKNISQKNKAKATKLANKP